tara:strand:+ start:2057 stop:3262 length:1206 start_codon:yes stop_codon:yes gene_type:complete
MVLDVRQNKTILVVEAQALGMIGVIRGLGTAGYRVIAASCHEDALGLQSNFASEAYVCPSYDSGDYLVWLNGILAEKKIDAIVPSEGFLLAIQDHFEAYTSLLPGNVDKATTFKCLSKSDVFHSFLSADDQSLVKHHIPKTIVVTAADEVPTEKDLARLGLPIWIKVDACHARGVDNFGTIIKADTQEDAARIIDELLPASEKILVQSHEVGVKATVNLCVHQGVLLARSECVATHENPHTGGLTALRHNWVQEAMFEDAMARIRHLEWDGVAMMEYKWDAVRQDFCFIEINSRFWAGLHVDLFTGINFPQIQLDAFFGLTPTPVLRPTRYLTVRSTLPADFGYMMSKVRDRNVADRDRLMAFLGFFGLFLNPFVKSDLLFPGDRHLYAMQVKKFVRDLFR